MTWHYCWAFFHVILRFLSKKKNIQFRSSELRVRSNKVCRNWALAGKLGDFSWKIITTPLRTACTSQPAPHILSLSLRVEFRFLEGHRTCKTCQNHCQFQDNWEAGNFYGFSQAVQGEVDDFYWLYLWFFISIVFISDFSYYTMLRHKVIKISIPLIYYSS